MVAGVNYKDKPPSLNHHLIKHIQVAETGGGGRGRSAGTTELDSQANMVVIGAQRKIIQKTGRYADVNAFSLDVETMSRVPIVDAAIAYYCPFSGRTILMVASNALYVESMDHTLYSTDVKIGRASVEYVNTQLT